MKLFAIFIFIVFISFVFADDRVGKPLNISYDGRAILINGSHTLLISGSVHYPRSTPMMWDGIMKKTVAAGVNILQTYVFWNLHEPLQGEYNFEGNADLIQFLNVAKSNGLFVNLRIGPYVCAEWNYGGFPEWLREIPGVVFRDYNLPFMIEMEKWVAFVVDLMKKNNMFAPQGGPIIMAQIENEYGNVMSSYGAQGVQYAEWSASMANNLTTGVPWIMCQQGDISTVINTCNGFYCDSFVAPHIQQWPDQPPMWTENWPGWFQAWGQSKPHRPVQDIAFAVARWFAKGGSYMNYYMWHGGTNFARSAGGPGIVTSYDYDVALDEYGYPSEPKYTHSSNLHSVLIKYADIILANSPQNTPLGTNLEADVYGTGSDQIAFLSNIGTNSSAVVTFQGVNFTLPMWSVSLVANGQVLFNTATLPSTYSKYSIKNKWNQVVKGTFTGWWSEQIGDWGTSSQFSTPPMQLDVTHDLSDYLWYTTTVEIQDNHTLHVGLQDRVLVYLNNNFVGAYGGGQQFVELPASATGYNELQLLVVTYGLLNGGAFQEKYVVGLIGDLYMGTKDITKGTWVVQPGLEGEYNQIYTPDGNPKVLWNSDLSLAVNCPLTWFTGTFDLPPNPNQTTGFALDLGGMTKGMAFVNGYMIGRYWNITGEGDCTCNWAGSYDPNTCRTGCGEISQRYYHVPQDWLNPTNNLVVIFEEVGGDPSTISLVTRTAAEVTVQGEESSTLEIYCDNNSSILNVDFASFGPKKICATGLCSDSCSTEGVAQRVVEKLCLGLFSCEIPIQRDLLGGDQCISGSLLTVQVTCG